MMAPGDTLTLVHVPKLVSVSWNLAWLLGLLVIIGTYQVVMPILDWMLEVRDWLRGQWQRFWTL